jgi:hypothetical protein
MSARSMRQVAALDIPGGGQVVVDGTIAYVGHTKGPRATTIVDVADPKNPKVIAALDCPHRGVHAHKVRVKDGLMLTNYESKPYVGVPEEGFVGGLHVWDVEDPRTPRLITFWPCDRSGVHRFTFDGRYAYLSPELEGYRGNIVLILDLAEPARPVEVGRWWAPGQWTAGGETPTWQGTATRCHHPIRRGDRLYVSYWFGGWFILDIADLSRPRLVSSLGRPNPYPYPTHTALPMPQRLQGRDFMLVADEDCHRPDDAPGSFVWLWDIDDETNPLPVSTFQVAAVDGTPRPQRSGCHQPAEAFEGTEIPIAWFSEGVRVVDFANPHAPREVAHFVPEPMGGEPRILSNDVCLDDRGLIYVTDRNRGLHVLERT